MRVTHVHRIGGIGGSERHLLTLLPALASKGVDVRFVGLDMPGADPFYDELDVPFDRVSRPWQLRRALKRAQPDLVHTHLVHADVYGAVSTYFSDAGFRARLSGIDPMTPESRARFADTLTAMLRDALAPR